MFWVLRDIIEQQLILGTIAIEAHTTETRTIVVNLHYSTVGQRIDVGVEVENQWIDTQLIANTLVDKVHSQLLYEGQGIN